MGRGAAYHKKFQEFLTNGGIANYKNAVAMNIRMNFVGNLDMIGESFEAAFFLDTAYWVPKVSALRASCAHLTLAYLRASDSRSVDSHLTLAPLLLFTQFDRAHHSDPETCKKFAEYEPQFDFPDTLAEIKGRETEFSQDKTARRHECQLGQNAETLLDKKPKKGDELKGPMGDPLFTSPPRALQGWRKGDGLQADLAAKKHTNVKHYARVGDKTSHWPRLWRVLVSDAELTEMESMGKDERGNDKRKKFEPSNGKPEQMHSRLKELFKFCDAKRAKNLSHPDEGIVFATYDVACKSRQVFSLQKFPYDFQELCIVVRLTKDHHDPFTRHIVPVCHDKAFFCSSRGTVPTSPRCISFDAYSPPPLS